MSPTLRIAARATVILVLVSALGIAVPSPLAAVGQILDIHKPLGDFDLRSGSIAPSASQTALVEAMGASVSWNRFGTPRSLVKHGGLLGSAFGADAEEMARQWLEANRGLFRLSLADVQALELYEDVQMVDSDAHVVIFRQRFGALMPTLDGLVLVGVSDGGIAYVSSSLTDTTGLAGSVDLSPQDAFLAAAANLGRLIDTSALLASKVDGDWTVIAVDGLAQLQRVRLTGLPSPGAGARPAYETLFVDVQGGKADAYRQFVDAETGDVVVRQNMVYNSHPAADTFTGVMPALDGACDADQGPWTIDPGETVISIDALAEANLTTNDMVLHLKRNGVIVATQDTLFSPEALHYEPPGGVLPGAYTVQVCDYPDAAIWSDPRDYFGSIAFNETTGASVAYPPKWRVFESSPRLPTVQGFPWNLPDEDNRKLWCWDSVVQGVTIPGCDREVENLAARFPWDYVVRANGPSFSSLGNSANTAESWSSPLTPGLSGQRATSSARAYSFDWENRWNASLCNEAIAGVGTPGGNDIESAVANLFAMHNRMHDWSYLLGFTEETWNAQESNMGNGGLDRDPLQGDAQAGAVDGGYPSYLGRDNANMIALVDGAPPITNMYLWQPLRGVFYAPCVDGDYDMSVIGHEFTHLLESRLTGKGFLRSGDHAGAMGESWGDLLGVEYLNEYSYVPVDDENPFAVGPYDTGDKVAGIRNYGMNASPLNFSNMDYDPIGPFSASPHANGEIWSATQFDVRELLNAKYDADYPSNDPVLQKACADGKRPAKLCPGNRRWVQLGIDELLLIPTAPTMLDARDAMLAADMMRFGGDNQAEIWLAYARRGFGAGAATSDQNDVEPTPDFASPLHSNATVTFSARAVDEGNAAITNARVYVGHYEAYTSPIADTNPGTSGANFDDVAEFAPGSYEFIAHAPGYGHVRFSRTFAPGDVASVVIDFATNRASSAKGATAGGDGAGHGGLIDDTESTNWGSTVALPPVSGQQVTVNLQGTSPVTVSQVNVSAMLVTGQNRFTALRQFRIDVSTDGVLFTPAFTSSPDAFPGSAPRPRVPEWTIRSFTLPAAVPATHVRLVVLENQCTGNTQFQGVQDDDPLNATDCRTGQEVVLPGSFADRDNEVYAAELQVFSTIVSN